MMKRLYSPVYMLGTILFQVVGAVIIAVSLLPSYFLVSAVWDYAFSLPNFWRGVFLCLSLGCGFFLYGNTLLLTIVVVKRITLMRNNEITADFRTHPAIIPFAVLSSLINLAQSLFLPLVRGTPIIVWFYRGMGAKIGQGTVLTTTRIYDCDLLEIGKHCVIGGGVAISAHTGEGRQGVLKKVIIGNRVTIGADTYIMPGAVIEDNVIIGANSMIPKDERLSANAVYGGVPVRKLGSASD